MIDPGLYLRTELVDLGRVSGPEFAGILQPRPEVNKDLVGVTNYFLEGAQDYHAKFQNHQRFEFLIRRALKAISHAMPRPAILDVGSGSGNSVIPLLKMYPDAPVVACDISPNILRILRDSLRQDPQQSERCLLVATDLMNNHFRPAVFDLAVGAAILHHILDVEQTLKSVHQALKPGAVAMFFEPFEAGGALLRMAFQHILDLADAPAPDAGAAPATTGRSLDPEIRRFLRRRIVDFDRRIATDIEVKKTLDDKWYFTRSWFEDVAARVGFSSVRILNNQITDHPLLTQTQTYLRNGLGRTRDALPAFAWQILEGYENAMSVHLRNDMLTTGTVILTK